MRSRDIKMEQLKFYELLIMSVKGYPHVYDKSKASSKDGYQQERI